MPDASICEECLNEIFNVDEYPRYSIKRFTFPNVKDGSILEYTYRKESYFFSNFGNWQFQSDLPKVYSELYTKIPGNMKYNRTLYGSKSLDINNAEIEKNCFTLPGYGKNADCEAATYGMKPIISHQRVEFSLLSLEQIINQISKWKTKLQSRVR